MSRYQLSPGEFSNHILKPFFQQIIFQTGAFGYPDDQAVNNHTIPSLLQQDIAPHLSSQHSLAKVMISEADSMISMISSMI